MGLFDKLFGKKTVPENCEPVPSPAPVLSPFEKIQASIANNPKSAGLRVEFAEEANYQLLDLPDYVFGKDPLSFVAFDLETTGLSNSSDSIVEIGAVRVADGEIVERFHYLVNPDCHIPSCSL